MNLLDANDGGGLNENQTESSESATGISDAPTEVVRDSDTDGEPVNGCQGREFQKVIWISKAEAY